MVSKNTSTTDRIDCDQNLNPDDARFQDVYREDVLKRTHAPYAEGKLEMLERWNSMAESNNGVFVDPQINHGRPTIAGTRIPVSRVIGYLHRRDIEGLLRDFPALDEEKVRNAVHYTVNLLGG